MVDAIRRLGTVWGAAVWRERRGVTAIEYALMAGAIAVVLVLAMVNLNSGISTAFHTAGNAFPK